jgi:hypothetical protein
MVSPAPGQRAATGGEARGRRHDVPGRAARKSEAGFRGGLRAKELAAAVGYQSWTSAVAHNPLCDGPAELLWGDSVVRGSISACNAEPDGPLEEILAEAKAARGWIATLWKDGTPVDGPTRLRVVRHPSDVPNNRPKVAWPLQVDIESLAIDLPEDLGLSTDDPGHLAVDDPGNATLRGYRGDLLAGKLSEYDGQELFISVESAGKSYDVFFRDTLPQESDKGLLRPPAP